LQHKKGTAKKVENPALNMKPKRGRVALVKGANVQKLDFCRKKVGSKKPAPAKKVCSRVSTTANTKKKKKGEDKRRLAGGNCSDQKVLRRGK